MNAELQNTIKLFRNISAKFAEMANFLESTAPMMQQMQSAFTPMAAINIQAAAPKLSRESILTALDGQSVRTGTLAEKLGVQKFVLRSFCMKNGINIGAKGWISPDVVKAATDEQNKGE